MATTWHEANKQEFLNKLTELLRMTSCAGHPLSNPLREIKLVTNKYGDEIARPIFEDGTGEDGYYDVNVSGDSNMGTLIDLVNKFINRMW